VGPRFKVTHFTSLPKEITNSDDSEGMPQHVRERPLAISIRCCQDGFMLPVTFSIYFIRFIDYLTGISDDDRKFLEELGEVSTDEEEGEERIDYHKFGTPAHRIRQIKHETKKKIIRELFFPEKLPKQNDQPTSEVAEGESQVMTEGDQQQQAQQEESIREKESLDESDSMDTTPPKKRKREGEVKRQKQRTRQLLQELSEQDARKRKVCRPS